MPRARLNWKIQSSACATGAPTRPLWRASTKSTSPRNATRKFETGPAAATRAMSRRGCRRLAAFTGTGLAHPKPAMTKARAPKRSMCGSGFRVIRPSARGVGSPSRSATRAWATSWMVTAISSAGILSARSARNAAGSFMWRPPGEPARRLLQAEPCLHLRVHQDVRHLAAQDAQHLRGHLHRRRPRRFLRHAGHVGRHDDVVHVEQRVVRRARLLLEHVEAGGGEMAARERLEDGALLLHGAARGVDVDRALLHEAEGLVVDHAARLVREWRVRGQDVDLWQHRLQALLWLDAALPQLGVWYVGVVAEHAHAEGAGELRHAAADVADTDDAEGLAPQLRVADAGPRAPIALAGGLVDRERPLDAREHQHQRVLCHRLRVRAGGVHDGDSAARGRGNVDGVEAHAVTADHRQVRTGGHQAVGAAR